MSDVTLRNIQIILDSVKSIKQKDIAFKIKRAILDIKENLIYNEELTMELKSTKKESLLSKLKEIQELI